MEPRKALFPMAMQQRGQRWNAEGESLKMEDTNDGQEKAIEEVQLKVRTGRPKVETLRLRSCSCGGVSGPIWWQKEGESLQIYSCS